MSGCFSTQVAEAKDAVTALTPQQAAMFKNQGDVIFVDPRPATAIASTTGIIPGAHNVSLEDIREGNLPHAMSNRSVHVITSCQAGPMGAVAAHELAKQGFSRVHFVEGGTQGWLDAGYPTDR